MAGIAAGATYVNVTGGDSAGPDRVDEGTAADSEALAAWQDELQAAADTAGFDVKLPTVFATKAHQLVFVDVSRGPSGAVGGLALVELIYQSENPWTTIDGQPVPSTVEIFLKPGSLTEPSGVRVAETRNGFDVYELVVGSAPSGEATKTSYTAVADAETIIMDFTGEQPEIEAVVGMLESFEVVASP